MNARDGLAGRSTLRPSDKAEHAAKAEHGEHGEHGEHAVKAPVPVVATAASGASRVHESAAAQVTGSAIYVDDIPEVKGTLFAAPVMSIVAHGRLLHIDCADALAMPGVRDVILARDVPGHCMLAAFAGDEPIFEIGRAHV